MTRSTGRRKRPRGSIETLPSGALRARVYAGVDPLSGRRRYIDEVAHTPGDAERAITRLLAQVDERRQPRTNATLNQLLDRWLEVAELEATTREDYVKRLDKHVRPALGNVPAGRVDAEMLETLYAQLRRCRDRCRGRRRAVEHMVDGPHDCADARCRRHECRGLAAASIRKIHYTLSAAYERGVRWRWLAANPTKHTEPPAPTPANPTPPSAEEAARILDNAWSSDPAWGLFLWLAMTTGARRGELCGVRWRHVDFAGGVLTIERNVVHAGGGLTDKDTKTHQKRRIAIDAGTADLLRVHLATCEERARALGMELPATAFVFSLSPDGSTPLVPHSVTQRYTRLLTRLKLNGKFHGLRHYSATELIAAGVDLRTVAGRLGHGGGGTTTLKVYAAWLTEGDRRAADVLAARMPRRHH